MKKNIVDKYFDTDRRLKIIGFVIINIIVLICSIILIFRGLYEAGLILILVALIVPLLAIYRNYSLYKMREDRKALEKEIYNRDHGIKEIEVESDEVLCPYCNSAISKNATTCPFCKAKYINKR